MRVVKATLFAAIALSLTAMWSNRGYVADAYETTPNTLQLRLSGVDLAVTRTELEPSPFSVPAAPDTRLQPPPVFSTTEAVVAHQPVAISGGRAAMRGTVTGPDGPLAGALVGIERHTSHGIAAMQLATDEEGNWFAGGLPGGRYRVRAWVPGLMTMGGSEVTFLADDGVAEFGFSLWGVDPSPAMQLVDGGPIYQGLSGSVAVVVSTRSVDVNGVVLTTPVIGLPVSVQVSPEVTLTSNPTQYTDDQGSARFVVACIAATYSPLDPETPAGGLVQGSTGGSSVGRQLTGPEQSVEGDDHGEGDQPTSAGTLTATWGSLTATFPLPGCVPIPEPAPDEPTTEQSDG